MKEYKSNPPNVYLIILDGYANNKSLEKYWHFNNNSFTDYLQKKNFYYTENTNSNYKQTAFTLASMLNIEYLPKDVLENEAKSYSKIENNFVTELFRKNGYDIYNFLSVSKIYGEKNIFIHINDDTNFNLNLLINRCVLLKIINQFWNSSSVYKGKLKREIAIRNKYFEILKQKSDHPKLILYHSLEAHAPFEGFINENSQINELLNHNFEKKAIRSIGNNKRDSLWMSVYLNHIKIVNFQAMKLINETMKYDENAIIMLFSDHGFRCMVGVTDEESKRESYQNFTAIYFPDRKYNLIKNTRTPIGFISHVINKALDLNFRVSKELTGL